MTPVIAEVNRWLAVTYAWGWNDCVTLCGDWIQQVTGTNPADYVRGTYESAAECQRVHRFFTDPVGAVSPWMEKCGFEVTKQPVKGDVGIVLMQPEGGVALPHMALNVGRFWALKAQSGEVLTFTPFKVVIAWSVGYKDA